MTTMFCQGDIIEFDFSPSEGHEPKGRRLALVVSTDRFNIATSMTLVCPVTTTDNGFPLHMRLRACFSLPNAFDARHYIAFDCIDCVPVWAHAVSVR